MTTNSHTSLSQFLSTNLLLALGVMLLVTCVQSALAQKPAPSATPQPAKQTEKTQKPPDSIPPPEPPEIMDLWLLDGDNIYNANEGNVGVGLYNPSYKLDILSSINTIARFSTSAVDNSEVLINAPSGYNAFLTLQHADVSQWFLGNHAGTNRFSFTESTGTTEVFTILQSGKVGVGTTSPGFRFDVQGGQVNASGGLCIANDCKTAWSQVGGSQWTTSGSNVYYNAGNVGLGTTTPGVKLDIDSSGSGVGAIRTKTALGQNVFQYLKPDGTNLLRAMWDGGNFHHYLDGNLYFNLNGYSVVFTGGTLAATTLRVDSGGNPAAWQSEGLRAGEYTYASAATPLTTQQFSLTTFGWNGSNGSSLSSNAGLRLEQVSAANQDARLSLVVGNTQRLSVLSSGAVGVGTTTPGYRLDVQGGQVNTSGGLCIAGDCKTAWSQVGGSQWTSAIGASIYYTMGNVGIGTTTPGSPLEVSSNQNGIARLALNNPSSGSSAQASFSYFEGGTEKAKIGVNSSGAAGYVGGQNAMQIWNLSNAPMVFGTNGAERMRVSAAGSVGIGTAAPGYRLDVQGGQVNSSGGLCIAGDCKTAWSQVGGSQWTTTGSDVYYNSGSVGIGTTTPQSTFQIGGQTGVATASPLRLSLGGTYSNTAGVNFKLRLYDDGVAGNIYGLGVSAGSMDFGVSPTAGYNWYSGGAHKMILSGTGNVGIGTATPNKSGATKALTVNGSSDSLYELAIGDVRKGTVYHDGSELSLNNNANGPLVLRTNNTEKVRIDANGNVGIGVAPTAKKLEVAGDLNASGTISGGNIIAKYQDVAEWVESSQALPAGTVVVLDHNRSNQVVASSQAYDTRVAGVISAQPGITLGERGENKVLVATTGRVKVKVDASAGPIQIGDLLVTSDVQGVARKSEPLNLGGAQIHRPGTLIGKALEPLAGGTGEILVLLSLQ